MRQWRWIAESICKLCLRFFLAFCWRCTCACFLLTSRDSASYRDYWITATPMIALISQTSPLSLLCTEYVACSFIIVVSVATVVIWLEAWWSRYYWCHVNVYFRPIRLPGMKMGCLIIVSWYTGQEGTTIIYNICFCESDENHSHKL
jgi:hypothetical protein